VTIATREMADTVFWFITFAVRRAPGDVQALTQNRHECLERIVARP